MYLSISCHLSFHGDFVFCFWFWVFFVVCFVLFSCNFNEFWFKTNQQESAFLLLSLSLLASRNHRGWTNKWKEVSAETDTDLESLVLLSSLLNPWCQGRSQPVQGCLCFGYSPLAPGSLSGCSSFADVQGCKYSLRMSLLTCFTWQKLIQNSCGTEKTMPDK